MILLQTQSVQGLGAVSVDELLHKFTDMGVEMGKKILIALVIFIIGRYVVKFLNRIVAHMLERSKADPAVQSFVRSMVNILLTILLVISVVGALGIETTSFAALLASAGVTIGMALSGQLQNFAGGIIILLFKPYKVGDYVESQSFQGFVEEIQIFHTVLRQFDNRMVFAPNGSMSTNALLNDTRKPMRRIQWTVSISYGEDFERVRQALLDIAAAHPLVLSDGNEAPMPVVELEALAESQVKVFLRAWCRTPDYWTVLYSINREIYERFNAQGIEFPFPQTTVHIAKS